MVWRTPKEELDPKRTVSTVKYGGGNVKCWGCFSSCDVGNLVFIDGNVTGEVYHDILQKNLFESIKKLDVGREWVMQQDNDPKRRAHIVTHWLKEKGVELLKWPPFSPHRAYVGSGGKKNEKREAEERNRTETIFTSSLARYRHRCHKEVGRFRAKSIEWISN